MSRDILLIFFTLAIASISDFGVDIIKDLGKGNYETVVNGIKNSWLGFTIAIVVVIATGWLIFKFDRANYIENKQRHTEIINAIKQEKDE